ncbi:FAD-binding oxidoreductase [Brochothrix campestris]|uniref:FAD-binding PCMH-type domain-containing protein n=1 Tax=Brochothrix campestris FSL F6-1037 TaxID=1265861 RepID=W7CZN1_9LIST|nr:FAD-binding oxidoreductase [Brochothrix campestris]EUJ42225.1 hypothetical protein BCAMP_00510 [Brochothrix campestris FSL F6-1037]
MSLDHHTLEIPANLQDLLITKSEAIYRNVRSSYMKVGTPELIFMATSTADVANVVQYVAKLKKTDEHLAFSIRSGGHGMSGSSTNQGGVVLDLSKMRTVELIDREKKLVRVQAGADWGTVAKALAPEDLIISSGNFGDVGVGGLAASGGIGYFTRSHGLTIDHIKAVVLVTADGTVHTVDATHEPDLFWAIRGAGSQLGVITEFVFEATHLQSDTKDAAVIYQRLTYTTDDVAQFVTDWGKWATAAPREMTSFLMIQKAGVGSFNISASNVWSTTDTVKATPVLEKAAAIAPLIEHNATITPYPTIIPHPQSEHGGQQRIQIWNGLIDKADQQLGEAIAEAFKNPLTLVMELRSIGGAMNDVAVEETAWAARYQEAFVSVWMMPGEETEQTKAFAPIEKLSTGVYGAYSSNTSLAMADKAWPGQTGERLRQLIARYDPQRLFNQGIHL